MVLDDMSLCDGSNDYEGCPHHHHHRHHVSVDEQMMPRRECVCDTYVPSYARVADMNSLTNNKCVSVLQDIKSRGHKHWDAIGVVIDLQPTPTRPFRSSLGVLRNLDFVFMRPKFVLIKLGNPNDQQKLIDSFISRSSGERGQSHNYNNSSSSSSGSSVGSRDPNSGGPRSLRGDVKEALAILTRAGYMASEDTLNMCDADADGASGVCVWGSRVTTVEFSDMLKLLRTPAVTR
jgi:hypothetical protein